MKPRSPVITKGGTASRAVRPRGFDADAKKILKQYLDFGWTASESANGHIILRAPDGITTTALGPHTNGRTGKNAIAPLNRWLRNRNSSAVKSKPVVLQPRKEAMSTVTTADVLTAAFSHSLKHDARPMSNLGEAEHFTQVTLTALREAGIAVIELPPPAGMNEDGQIWFDTTEHCVDTTGRDPEIWWGHIERTVDQLRTQAAELLSVAALVDAIKSGEDVAR